MAAGIEPKQKAPGRKIAEMSDAEFRAYQLGHASGYADGLRDGWYHARMQEITKKPGQAKRERRMPPPLFAETEIRPGDRE